MKHIPLQIGFRKVFRLPGSRAAFKTERKLSFLQFFIEKTENGVKLHGLLFGEEVM